MSNPTDEELDALVQRLHGTPLYEGHGEASETPERAADAITTLRTQLAEVQEELSRRVDMHECAMAERDDATLYGVEQKARADRAEAALAFTVSDGQRLLRKQDILTVCDTPDLCFEHDDGVARCGPCAAKLAERAGIALNQYTVSNPEAMRMRRDLDRAEAALAAQIERDAGIALKHRNNLNALTSLPPQSAAAWDIYNEIRAQPHGRTALDRMLAEAREKALREAADMFDADSNIAQTILALIETTQ